MPNLKGFHKQPANSMVCGAYALTSILDAFGLLPANGMTTLDFGGRRAAVFDKTSGLAVARNIYSVTGCGPGGNNLPAAMSYVAISFGLKAKVAFAKGCPLLKHPVFGALFSKEQALCKKLGTGGTEEAFSTPGSGVAQAICVDNRGGGFHWLALGENNLFMDPGTGQLHPWGKVKASYDPVGLWISMSN